MARQKEFNRDVALGCAIGVFREHGFEGTSAQMLVDAMLIGRQSLYDTFGDKWGLYRAAYTHYGMAELTAHLQALRSTGRAVDGIAAFLDRVVDEAALGCMGVGSIIEFGTRRPELAELRASLDRPLREALIDRIVSAQRDGDVASDLDPDQLASFLITSLAGFRVAARGGASRERLEFLKSMALRALR